MLAPQAIDLREAALHLEARFFIEPLSFQFLGRTAGGAVRASMQMSRVMISA
jgi:hypothetical protein